MLLPYRIDDDEYDFERKPGLVWGIMAACFGVYILTARLPERELEDVCYLFGCVPADFHWWSIFTCTLLHGGLMHLLGNMFYFWIYGPMCEKAYGHWKFLLLYLAGAAASMGGHMLMTPKFFLDIPCIGASGAISAVLGAFLVTFPTVRVKFVVFTFLFPRPLPASGPAWLILGGWFLMQLCYSLNMFGSSVEVAFWAHVAGFAAGALIGTLYLKLEQRRVKCEVDACLRRLSNGGELSDDELRWLDANGYIDRELITALTTTDATQAAFRLGKLFHRTFYDNQHGALLLCYYRFLACFGVEKLSAENHMRAMRAALALRLPGIAKYAGFQALVRDDDTAPTRAQLLDQLSLACRMSGDSAGEQKIRALMPLSVPLDAALIAARNASQAL